MLTAKERKFCEELTVLGNATSAALRAGYAVATAEKHSYKWVKGTREESSKPLMFDYVKQLREKLENEFTVSKGKVVFGLICLAMFDPAKLYDASGKAIPVNQLDEVSRMAIQGLETDQKGNIKKFRVADRNQAWSSLAKLFGYNSPEKLKHDMGETFLDFLKSSSSAKVENSESRLRLEG